MSRKCIVHVHTWSFEKYEIPLLLFFKKNLNESIPNVSNIQAYRLPTRKKYFTRWVIYKMYPTGTVQIDAAQALVYSSFGIYPVVVYRNLYWYTFVSKRIRTTQRW